MSANRANPGSAGGAAGSDRGDEGPRLVRCSHIFASAVREVLEESLLRQASPVPLTLPQFRLLRMMTYNGHHRLSEVAACLHVSPPAATKNIDKLERLDLVARTRSTGDRRATLLTVRPEGRRLVRRHDELNAAKLRQVLEGFTPNEIEELAGLLERFAVSLLGAEEGAGGVCLRCAAYLEEDCPVRSVRTGCPYRKPQPGTGGALAGPSG